MIMKYNFLYTICVVWVLVLATSCQDFLEKPISSDITIDSVFASKIRTEQFLWNVYNTCSIFEFPYFWDTSTQKYRHYGAYGCLVSAATDELQLEPTWPAATRFLNNGTWNATNIQDLEFNSGYCYEGIRNANIFIENIDKSPFSDKEKREMKAEAIFLRALMHFDLMQRLGGVAIVDKVLSVSGAEDVEKNKIPRSTFAQTVDFVVQSCTDAARVLPNQYESKYRGRIVKGAALALKARTLLYAASPLYNSGEPYVAVSNPALREMIGYPTRDDDRWRLAAEASKAVLDWAQNESGWCALYEGMSNPVDRYEEIFINSSVPEIILDAGLMGTATNGYFCRYMLPGYIMGQHEEPVNHAITFNFTKFYQKTDGTDQVWDEQENQPYPYTQYCQKLAELDPRFQASVFQSGTEWSRGTGTVYHFYETNNLALKNIQGVGLLRKFVKGVKNNSSPAPRWITFRLAEFYLNYAEALNEINGSTTEIEWALQKIRSRVDMPPIYHTGDQIEMRKIIHRERAVELAFEEHRFFDLRRWKEASKEGVMSGDIYTLKLYPGSTPAQATYRLEKAAKRMWDDKMYLYPFKQKEVDLGYIVQNPRWSSSKE